MWNAKHTERGDRKAKRLKGRATPNKTMCMPRAMTVKCSGKEETKWSRCCCHARLGVSSPGLLLSRGLFQASQAWHATVVRPNARKPRHCYEHRFQVFQERKVSVKRKGIQEERHVMKAQPKPSWINAHAIGMSSPPQAKQRHWIRIITPPHDGSRHVRPAQREMRMSSQRLTLKASNM